MVGSHGVQTLRVMSRKQFESISKNKCGFVTAHFGMSEYKVWGATEESGTWVLQILLHLDNTPNSWYKDPSGMTHFTDEFANEFLVVFDKFFAASNSSTFEKNSNVAPEFASIASLPWMPPDIIVVTAIHTENGQPIYNLFIEEYEQWENAKNKYGMKLGAKYLYHLAAKFDSFGESLKRNFDSKGNFIGSPKDQMKSTAYKPKNR